METRELLATFLKAHTKRTSLPEQEVKGFLRELGIAVPRGVFIPAHAPCPSALPLSWPLVVKVVSPLATSKTEAEGIRFGIDSHEGLELARADLMRIEGAEGVLLEETAPPGVEVIVGGIVDPQFGPVVMFGLGGLFVELFRDVAFALAPITRDDAYRLIDRTRGGVLIHGFRGKPSLDREALAKTMVIVGELISSGLLEEIDLNPVVLYPRGAVALDAKVKPSPLKACP